MTKLVATGIEFPDATTQTTAQSDIGVGQTWQNVAGSRSAGVTYTNSSGKSISMAVSTIGTAYITVGGVLAAVSGIGDATNYLGAIIPNGTTYSMTGAVGIWAELRG
jgi:hypothetical protein